MSFNFEKDGQKIAVINNEKRQKKVYFSDDDDGKKRDCVERWKFYVITRQEIRT